MSETADHVARQMKEAMRDGARITCGCGNRLKLYLAFRCLYCGAWFCQTCAEIHFGKTREQYDADRQNKIDA